MKRLKFLPSVLLLVLCVGVLCMGIYAASPNSNQITGSITINPANAAVNIRAWAETADGTRSGEVTKTNVRNGGETISFADLDNIANILKLDFGSASTVNDVKPCYIKIEITNNSSTKELGAYISNQEIAKAEAEKSDIFTTKAMTNSEKVDATSLEFYKQMGVADANGDSDTATLILEFKANDFIETAGTITFNDYYVNIEEYNPNMIGETVTDTSSGFIKISSTIESAGAQSLSTTKTPRLSIGTSAGFSTLTTPNDLWVVVPNGVTSLSGFGTGCTALTKISLPNTLTSIGGVTAPNLELYDLPSSITSIQESSINFTTETTSGGIVYKGLEGNKYLFAYSFTEATQTEYIFNNNTKVIKKSIFYKDQNNSGEVRDNITSITIPEGVIIDSYNSVVRVVVYGTNYPKANGVGYIKSQTNANYIAVLCDGYAGNAVIASGCKRVYTDAEDYVGLNVVCKITNVEIPNSVEHIDMFRGAYPLDSTTIMSITINPGTNVTFNLPSSLFMYSCTWYTNADYTGDPVDKIVPNTTNEKITYYPKVNS